jgi:SAM-dependent methyltransferase
MPEATYEKKYLEWKNWREETFAFLDKGTKSYFDVEISHALGRNINNIKVLEIGFGHGQFLEYTRQKGWEVIGIEINPEALSRARDNGFVVFHSDELGKIESCEFDLIVMFDVLEHIHADDAIELLNTLRPLLSVHGKMILRFPNGVSPLSLPLQNGDYTHVNYIGADKIKFMAAQSGMDVEGIFSQARAIRLRKPIESIIKLSIVMLHAIINKLISWAFYGGSNVLFSSLNLIVILRQKP